MFEFLAFMGIVAVVGLVVLAGAFVVGTLKIALKLALLPLVLAGFLIKAVLAVALGLVAFALLVPFALSGLLVLALPLLLVVAIVWTARKIVVTA
jgi:hypothetical protein